MSMDPSGSSMSRARRRCWRVRRTVRTGSRPGRRMALGSPCPGPTRAVSYRSSSSTSRGPRPRPLPRRGSSSRTPTCSRSTCRGRPTARRSRSSPDEAGGLTFRVVPADGSAPVAGGGASAVVRTGSPFYFDWIGSDRVLAHIGTGTNAFLGEIGRDGSPVAPPIKNVGDFRSAVVSADGKYVGYVQAGSGTPDSVVLVTRDGTRGHSMPVYGTAALGFDPTGDQLAAIGPTEPTGAAGDIPVGPLRIVAAGLPRGQIRTLLDGSVVSFAWSPDGRTIAALRVVPVPGGSTVASENPPTPVATGREPGPPDLRRRRFGRHPLGRGRRSGIDLREPGPARTSTSTRSAIACGRPTARRSSCRRSTTPGTPTSTSSSPTGVRRSRSMAKSGSGAPRMEAVAT